MSKKFYAFDHDDDVAQPSDIGVKWVDKTSVSTYFVFEHDTYNVLRKFSGGESLSFTMPIPREGTCCRVYARMDLSSCVGSVPSIDVKLPEGYTANIGVVSGDSLAAGGVFVLSYDIVPTGLSYEYDVIHKTTRMSAGSIFYLDSDGNVVTDSDNVLSDGTVPYDGTVLPDGTMQVDVM